MRSQGTAVPGLACARRGKPPGAPGGPVLIPSGYDFPVLLCPPSDRREALTGAPGGDMTNSDARDSQLDSLTNPEAMLRSFLFGATNRPDVEPEEIRAILTLAQANGLDPEGLY